jgi:hypothetical protein
MQKLSRLFPSAPEVWGIAFATLVLLLIGNGKDLLQRYGLVQSSQVVKNQLGHGIGSGLGILDSFTVTRSIVNFALWGVVGLIAFSFVHTLLTASNRLQEEKELSSNAYVHPEGFRRDSFWHHIVLHTVTSFGLLVLSAAVIVTYLFWVFPRSSARAGRFLLHLTPGHVTDLLIGLVSLFIGTYVVYVVLKLALRHHRVSRA